MNLADQVDNDIKTAMKARDARRLSALRLLKAALVGRSVEKGRQLEDAEAGQVVASMVKQRLDSIEQFAGAGRLDLVEIEKAEMAVLEAYQPPVATEEQLDQAVTAAIAESGATSPRDLGKVMKGALAKLAGMTVDGRAVSEAVRRKLSGG